MLFIRTRWAMLIGVIAGLLLARLIVLLFAARPDNPAVVILMAITAPLTAPFAWIDRITGQPQWGARLDVATLTALAVLLAVTIIIAAVRVRRMTSEQGEEHA